MGRERYRRWTRADAKIAEELLAAARSEDEHTFEVVITNHKLQPQDPRNVSLNIFILFIAVAVGSLRMGRARSAANSVPPKDLYGLLMDEVAQYRGASLFGEARIREIARFVSRLEVVNPEPSRDTSDIFCAAIVCNAAIDLSLNPNRPNQNWQRRFRGQATALRLYRLGVLEDYGITS